MPSIIDRFHSWVRGLLGSPVSGADQADSTAASVQIEHGPRESFVPYDENLLEQSRTQWQLGDWGGLTQLTRETLQHHPDRAKLALLAAAGQLQSNNISVAQQFIRAALDWGCSKRMVSQVLVSGVYSTLGNAAMAGGDNQRALGHFKTAALVGDQKANSTLLAETQLMRATLRLDQAHKAAAAMIVMASPTVATPTKPDVGITSYAQNFEDVMLWRALGRVENGFYIDVGAQDPVLDSVSKAFYDHGWRGIHVEPIAEYANALRQARPDEQVIEAVLAVTPGMQTFYHIPQTGISTGTPKFADRHREHGWPINEISVKVTALSQIFTDIGMRQIHWLKIDVEGMEAQVLEGWGCHPARPWIVVVEATEPLSEVPTQDLWEHFLFRYDYTFVYFDGLNRFYIRKDHINLAGAFDSPPNVFDMFKIGKSVA